MDILADRTYGGGAVDVDVDAAEKERDGVDVVLLRSDVQSREAALPASVSFQEQSHHGVVAELKRHRQWRETVLECHHTQKDCFTNDSVFHR